MYVCACVCVFWFVQVFQKEYLQYLPSSLCKSNLFYSINAPSLFGFTEPMLLNAEFLVNDNSHRNHVLQKKW